MKWAWIFITLVLLTDPCLTMAFGDFVTSGYRYFKSIWYEVCDEKWVHANLTGTRANNVVINRYIGFSYFCYIGLKVALQNRLYGQHLVIDNVVRALKAHLENKNPRKALVMSFHGWTGGR